MYYQLNVLQYLTLLTEILHLHIKSKLMLQLLPFLKIEFHYQTKSTVIIAIVIQFQYVYFLLPVFILFNLWETQLNTFALKKK